MRGGSCLGWRASLNYPGDQFWGPNIIRIKFQDFFLNVDHPSSILSIIDDIKTPNDPAYVDEC